MSRGFLVKSVMAAALAMVVAAPAVQAADLGGRPSYKDEPDYGPPRYMWSGLYAGLQAGYSWSDAYLFDGGGVYANPQPEGFLGGATLGYNFQRGSIVWGLETDFSFADVSGSHGVSSAKMDWLWTLRGRVGVDMNGWMPYFTGGLAVADVSASDNVGSGSETVTGWTIGGGLEVKLDRNWSFKGEYLYVNLDDAFRLSGPGGARATLEDMHVVRAGINYKF
ncbi:MAG: porin family protein [Hyphomicrobium sp.]|jgi:outer membrane immunogenic protein|nr:porin family protein [Hyphomicrobium sp.]